MKLIKLVVAVAFVTSTSLVSAGHTSPINAAPDVARGCPDWPFCRDVEISEQPTDVHQSSAKVVAKTA